jgi:hypothetical protein
MSSSGLEQAAKPPDPPVKPVAFPVGSLVADALRYWEPRRIVYNVLLALIVIGYFLAGWPASKSFLTLNGVFWVFFLAVLANVCYCAAYVVDIFVQLSPLRGSWMRVRWLLFLVGLAFAAVIARFFSIATFLPYSVN